MIGVSIKAIGLEEVKEKLRMLKEEFGSRIGGAQLHAVPRDGGGTPNDIIAEKLSGTLPTYGKTYKHRDFFGIRKPLPQADQQKIANAFMARFNEVFKLAPATGLESKGVAQINRKEAQNVAANCLRAAMRAYMAIVTRNIEEQTTVDGELDPLSDSYAEWKMKEYGFASPIGKATGQLLANLNESVPERNITITGNSGKSGVDSALSALSKLTR